MAAIKFPATQIERFNDRIENCLNDTSCRSIFKHFLTSVIRKDSLVYILQLWTKANESTYFDDDMYDFIDNVDGFNEDPLLTLSEPDQKIAFIKSECCRLFSRSNIHRRFIDYLLEQHKQ